MKFGELLEIVEEEPVFETSMLLSGQVDPTDIRRQLSRWTSNGRLYRLRRGLYALAPPFQKARPHPFVIANRLVRASYVSLQAALGFHGLIPEAVPVTTSITTGRPCEFSTPLGDFVYRHVRTGLFRGYRYLEIRDRQSAFVATPEKALLDLLYLEKGSDSEAFLAELRIEPDEGFDPEKLLEMAETFGQGKVLRAATRLIRRTRNQSKAFEVL